MTLEPISKLFTGRDLRIDGSDIQYGVEHFLQQELHSERIHCRVSGASLRTTIHVGTTALAEAVYIREKSIRRYVQSQLQCSLGEIRVMLDV